MNRSRKRMSETSARLICPERNPLGGHAIWNRTHPRIRLWDRSGNDLLIVRFLKENSDKFKDREALS